MGTDIKSKQQHVFGIYVGHSLYFSTINYDYDSTLRELQRIVGRMETAVP